MAQTFWAPTTRCSDRRPTGVKCIASFPYSYLPVADPNVWYEQLAPYIPGIKLSNSIRYENILHCPSTMEWFAGGEHNTNYGLCWAFCGENGYSHSPSITRIKSPSELYYLCDATTYRFVIYQSSPPYRIDYRHLERTTMLFADFHVESLHFVDINRGPGNNPPWQAW